MGQTCSAGHIWETRRSCGQSLGWIKDWQQVRTPLTPEYQRKAPLSAQICCVRACVIVGSPCTSWIIRDVGMVWDSESTHSFEASLTITHGLAAVIHHPGPSSHYGGGRLVLLLHRNTSSSLADNRMWGSSKTNKRYCVWPAHSTDFRVFAKEVNFTGWS